MITVEEAKRQLMEAVDEYQSALAGCPQKGPMDPEEFRAMQQTIQGAAVRCQKAVSKLASLPHVFPHICCWMVDVRGKTEAGEDTVKEAVQQLKAAESAVEGVQKHNALIGGSMRKQVTDLVKNNGFLITDSGAGAEFWHIGCHCTTWEADALCALLHVTFAKAITAQWLVIERKQWSAGWKDF